MTDSGAEPSPLVLDATCLSHFARADRLDVLRDLLVGRRCWTTEIVLRGAEPGVADDPLLGHVSEQEWLLIAGLDSSAEIRLYDTWRRRVGLDRTRPGRGQRLRRSRATGGSAITDDRRAAQVGRVPMGWMSMVPSWLLAGACRQGKLTLGGTGALIDALRATGHRLPCTGTGFASYARQHGLL